MYPVYIQTNQLTLNDYLQVQALLSQRKHQEEQRRIQKASHRLQVLTELYRRRELEEQAIEAYYAKRREEELYLMQQKFQQRQQQLQLQQQLHRQQQIARQQQIEQQQQIERQKYYEALQQQQLQDQYRLWACQKSADCQPAFPEEEEVEFEESESEAEEESHQDQLARLVKLIFGVEETKEKERQEYDNENDYEVQEASDNEEENAKKIVENEVANNSDIDGAETMKLDGDMAMDDDGEKEEDIMLAMEHIDDNESMDEDFVHVPSLVKSNDIENLVDDILTGSDHEEQNFTAFDDEDPVKIAKYDALQRIEQELNEIQSQNEDHVLHVTLNISERAASPDTIITATTAENREFLGYEDRIVNILLKLDMIDADGDNNIRNERKSLVRKAEAMLEKLDEIKLKEWSRASHNDE